MRLFIPNETKEALAAENARLLMQAQANIGLLAGQMAASEARSRKQIELYQSQDHQRRQQPFYTQGGQGEPQYWQRS